MKFINKNIFFLLVLNIFCYTNIVNANTEQQLIKETIVKLANISFAEDKIDDTFNKYIKSYNLNTATGEVEPLIIKDDKSIIEEKIKNKISIFFVKDAITDKNSKIIVPLHGIYENHVIKGYLSINIDGDTIEGLKLYQNELSPYTDYTLTGKKISKDAKVIQPYLDALFNLKTRKINNAQSSSSDATSGATAVESGDNNDSIANNQTTETNTTDATSGATSVESGVSESTAKAENGVSNSIANNQSSEVSGADATSGATSVESGVSESTVEVESGLSDSIANNQSTAVSGADATSGAIAVEDDNSSAINENTGLVNDSNVNAGNTEQSANNNDGTSGATEVSGDANSNTVNREINNNDAVSGASEVESQAPVSKDQVVTNINKAESVFYVWFSDFGYEKLLKLSKEGFYK